MYFYFGAYGVVATDLAGKIDREELLIPVIRALAAHLQSEDLRARMRLERLRKRDIGVGGR